MRVATALRSVVLAAAMLCPRAWAGTPVLLPAGESPEVWRPALAAADLEVAVVTSAARVRIEAAGVFWRVVAVEDGAITRTMTVAAPTTDAERTEVAVLARALTRPLHPLDRPSSAMPPPPPAPIAPAPKPAPVVRAPAPAPAPVPVVTAPEPVVAVAEPEPEAEPVDAEPPPFVPPPDTIVVVERAPAAPEGYTWALRRDRSRRPRSTASAPLTLAIGMGYRDGVQVAGHVALRVDVLTVGPVFAATEVGIAPMRGMPELSREDVDQWLWRGYWDLPALGVVGITPSRGVRLAGVAGVAYRGFRQQSRAVEEYLVPLIGGEGELSIGGRVRFGLRGRFTTDLRPITMQNSLGRAFDLVPWEVGGAVVFRVGTYGDPKRAAATL